MRNIISIVLLCLTAFITPICFAVDMLQSSNKNIGVLIKSNKSVADPKSTNVISPKYNWCVDCMPGIDLPPPKPKPSIPHNQKLTDPFIEKSTKGLDKQLLIKQDKTQR